MGILKKIFFLIIYKRNNYVLFIGFSKIGGKLDLVYGLLFDDFWFR